MKLENILSTTIRKDSFVITKEMVINGSFSAESPGQVSGTVNGDIVCKGRVLVPREGIVNGNVTAEELLIYGRINGDVKSCNKINVQSGAVITGNVNTVEIHIEKNAVIMGIIIKSGTPMVLSKKSQPAQKNEPSRDTIGSHYDHDTDAAERQTWF